MSDDNKKRHQKIKKNVQENKNYYQNSIQRTENKLEAINNEVQEIQANLLARKSITNNLFSKTSFFFKQAKEFNLAQNYIQKFHC